MPHNSELEQLPGHSNWLRVTLSSISDAVIRTDNGSRVLLMNRAAEHLTGWSEADATGRTLSEVFRILDEATRQPIENPAFYAIQSGSVGGPQINTILVSKDGVEKIIEHNAAPINEESGENIGSVLIFRDVSDRFRLQKQIREQHDSERFLASIVESSNDAIVSKSLDGVIQTWNVGAQRLFGYTPQQAIGSPISLIIPEERMQDEELILSRISAGERVEHYETIRRTNAGALIHVSITVSPIRNESGIVVGASKIARDISDRKRDEDAIRRLASDLSEMDRRKDEFLATLAHELRNPLAPIRSGLQVLQLPDISEEEANETRLMMERQLGQLVRLVDDLMDVSRIVTGKIELQKKSVLLSDVLNSAIETSCSLIDQMHHKLTVSLPSSPIRLEADFTRLSQVFLNLLNNAAKYSEPGGNIHVEATLEGNEVVISVRDSGIGIAPEHQPIIFDLFTQADQSLEKSRGGLGIGLSLVRRLVEMHGGTVKASSAGAGCGSEFVVRIPNQVARPNLELDLSPKVSVKTGASLRILVVDDNRDSVTTLTMLLKRLGHETRAAFDGEEAVAAAREFHPQVVLLDIGLPKLNGYEVCRWIRAQNQAEDVIIIAQTGWGQEETRKKTKDAGFDYHMVKPLDPNALRKILDQLTDKKVP